MRTGRPRAFDLDEALDKALEVFWQKGYEGASLPDLTAAMGINRPSLYAAFGNKESLFKRAIDRYIAGPTAYIQAALAKPTARQVAAALFQGGIEMVTASDNPRGCFLVQSALVCGDGAEAVRQALLERRRAGELLIKKRFAKAVRDGDLPAHVSPADLAKYVVVVMHGMAVQAASGAKRAELERVAALAMQGWPEA